MTLVRDANFDEQYIPWELNDGFHRVRVVAGPHAEMIGEMVKIFYGANIQLRTKNEFCGIYARGRHQDEFSTIVFGFVDGALSHGEYPAGELAGDHPNPNTVKVENPDEYLRQMDVERGHGTR
jgi:hypothetical protein